MRIQKVRSIVDWLLQELARIARLVRLLWPWRKSLGYIVAAQLELELKRARRAGAVIEAHEQGRD